MRELVKLYMARSEASNSKRTSDRYRLALDDFLERLEDPDNPAKADVLQALTSYGAEHEPNGYRWYVWLIRSLLRSSQQLLDDDEDIQRFLKIANAIKTPKKQDIKVYVPPVEDVQKMIDAVGADNGWRDACLIMTLARFGLRAGECGKITWDDVKFGLGTVQVGEKGGTKRPIPIGAIPEVMETWLRRRRWYEQRQRRRQDDAPEPHYVFSEYIEKPLVRSGVQMAIRRACDKAGVKRFGPHALRYFFAVNSIGAVGPIAVSKTMGHKNLATTFGYLERAAVPEHIIYEAFATTEGPPMLKEGGWDGVPFSIRYHVSPGNP